MSIHTKVRTTCKFIIAKKNCVHILMYIIFISIYIHIHTQWTHSSITLHSDICLRVLYLTLMFYSMPSAPQKLVGIIHRDKWQFGEWTWVSLLGALSNSVLKRFWQTLCVKLYKLYVISFSCFMKFRVSSFPAPPFFSCRLQPQCWLNVDV